ncbi:hypothetical protein O2K51_01925 [Apibacter raozihei]|uniref:hypothetical protein n=1 Tax=Apibacter raozihei TaxID=2500547 RepID=UPI000FE38AB7|nr:hypothetical protein [Apibacter raozihei]
MNNIDKDNIDKFISSLEKQVFTENVDKINYLNYIINNAKELIFVGEYKIAIENLIENLIEENIIFNKVILNNLLKINDKDIQELLKILVDNNLNT